MESLGIDFKLLLAQLVNILLLLFLFKKFLFKPLVNALEERKKSVEKIIEDTKNIELKVAEMENREKEVLAAARKKSQDEHDELIRLADEEKKEIIRQAKEAAGHEREKGLAQIQLAEEQLADKVKKQVLNELTDKLLEKLSQGEKTGRKPILDKLLS